MNAVLIGFTSSGKTSAGRLLAERLGFSHVDLDDCISAMHSERTGRHLSVRQVFGALGAEEFEQLEHQALKQLMGRTHLVLSTGGRAPVYDANRPILRALGKVIYLSTAPEVIFTRMQEAKGLPLYLRDDPTVDNLKRHWRQRDPVYRELSDVVIDNTRLSPEQTVDRIVTALERQRG